MHLFGIETEYGITREDLDAVDPVEESMELVRAHLTGEFERRWDYRGEDPHEDARGFRVSGLQQDKEEDDFATVDAHRPYSFHEMKSDLVLPNGARFYNDHTHPEYSTPECRTLKDLLAHDRAGERVAQRAADRRNQRLGGAYVQLYKNNTDFHGHSYGCHDNYLVARAIPFPQLTRGLLPFLVTRQVFAGAGKVGMEAQESGFVPGPFQLSQRADFMEAELGVDTMHNRPILNTRDEPHADRKKYRRLHLIVGDANFCEYATALKVGTTRLVLDVLQHGAAPQMELEQSVAAIKQLSRDLDLNTTVRLKDGRTMSGLAIQQEYWNAASRVCGGSDPDADWVLREWHDTLQCLGGDRTPLVGKLDWVTKQWLLETFMREEQLAWEDPWLASLDLEYHNLNPDRGLFLGLEAEGKTWRMTAERDIAQALSAGPSDTRGGLRGLCVRRFSEQITGMQWERVQFSGGLRGRTLEMGDLFEPEAVQACAALLESAASPADALAAWAQRKDAQ